jgi:predicted ATPase
MTSDYVTQLALERLGRDAAEQIATVVSGGVALPPTILEQILSTTDGNPLFIEELGKMVVEFGLAGSNLTSGPVGRRVAVAIPTTLRDSLMARLDRLGRSAREVAQLASAIGRAFSYELLRAVWQTYHETSERHAGGHDYEEELRGPINQLLASGLVYQSGLPRGSHYEFKHALVQKAAYDAMLEIPRRKLHERIAEQILARLPDLSDNRPELVAHHLTEAGLSERAISFWQQAGRLALERAANLESIAHFELALKLLECVPAGPSKDQTELEIQSGLSPAYMAIKGWASLEVERSCRRGRELGELCGNFRATYGFLWGLWTNLFLRGQLQQALDAGRQVLKLAETVTIPDSEEPSRKAAANLRVMAHHAVGYSHFYRGEFQQALEHAEAGLTLQVVGKQREFNLEGERDIVRDFQFSSSAALRIIKGCSLWMLGFADKGPREVDAAITLTHQLKHYPSNAYALAASLLSHHYSLDLERTAEAAEQLLALAGQESFEIWSPFALMFHGWVLTESGREEEGIAETRRGIAQWQATGSFLNQTIAMAMLARSLRRAGRLDEAITVLDAEIIEAFDRTELHFAPELHRLKGEILHDQGMPAASEASLKQAIDLARAQNARMLELRATVSLGRILAQTGRHHLARSRVKTVCNTLTEGALTPDFQDAQALLTSLDQPAIVMGNSSGNVSQT